MCHYQQVGDADEEEDDEGDDDDYEGRQSGGYDRLLEEVTSFATRQEVEPSPLPQSDSSHPRLVGSLTYRSWKCKTVPCLHCV